MSHGICKSKIDPTCEIHVFAQVTILLNYIELEKRHFSCVSPKKKQSSSSFIHRMKCTKKVFAAIWSKAITINDAKCTVRYKLRCLQNFLIVFIFWFVSSFLYSLFIFIFFKCLTVRR